MAIVNLGKTDHIPGRDQLTPNWSVLGGVRDDRPVSDPVRGQRSVAAKLQVHITL